MKKVFLVIVAAILASGAAAASEISLPPADFKAPPAGMVIEWSDANSDDSSAITILGRDGYWLKWRNDEGENRSGYTLFCWFCDREYSFSEDSVDSLFPLQVGKKASISRAKGNGVWADEIEVVGTETIEVPAGVFDVFVVKTTSRRVTGSWRGERLNYYAPALGWNVKIENSDSEGNNWTWHVTAIDGLTGITASTNFDDQEALRAERLRAFANQPQPEDAGPPVEIGQVTGVKTYAFGTPPGRERTGRFEEDRLVTNELVETIPGSALHAVFKDGTEFRMGSASQVRLDKYLYDPGQQGEMSMALGHGVFRFISGRIKQGTQITTPDAIIGIRGTDFIVEVTANGTVVTVNEGEVEVQDRNGNAATAPAGTVATVGPAGISTASAPAGSVPDVGLEAGGCGG
jgi:hypothetical protein